MLSGADDVKAVLLDLGGVIIDIDFGRAFEAWAAASGANPQELAQRFRFDESYRRHERGEISSSAYYESLRENLDINLSDDAFEQGWNAIFVGPIPGIEALLGEVAEYIPLYGFSNTNAVHHREWVRRFASVLEPLQGFFLSHELGLRKPEGRAFRRVATEIGVAARHILFFDDLPENVAGAQAVGMPAMVVTSPEDLEKPLRALLSTRVYPWTLRQSNRS